MVSDLQRRVVEAVCAGVPLVEIEAAIIEPAHLDEDEKAALWLYADALRDLFGRDHEPVLHGGSRPSSGYFQSDPQNPPRPSERPGSTFVARPAARTRLP